MKYQITVQNLQNREAYHVFLNNTQLGFYTSLLDCAKDIVEYIKGHEEPLESLACSNDIMADYIMRFCAVQPKAKKEVKK